MSVVKVEALDHLVLTVADLGVSLAFYSECLGMVPEVFTGTDGTQRHALTFGAQKINLHQVGQEFAPHAKEPKAGTADLCFLISGDVKQAMAELEAKGVRIEEGPIKRTGARGPILSIYLRDPDSNLIELSEQLKA